MAAADQLVELMFSWIKKRENCAKKLKKLADELKTLREKCNAAECVGSSVSVVGAASLFGAAVATFFTAGAAVPFLALAGGVLGGAGVAVSVTTKIIEHFSSSNTLKEAEKIEEENNKTAEEIKKQFKQLKAEVAEMDPSADPDHIDRLVMASYMGAVARRRSQSLQIDFSRLANEPGIFSGTQQGEFAPDPTLQVGLGIGVLAVLAFFTFKAEGKRCKDLIKRAVKRLTQKMTKTGLKTSLKRGAMVVGAAVGLAFALHEATDDWTDLIKNNHETEASRSLRETADDILKTCRVLREELYDTEEKVCKWAAIQEQEDRE